MPYGRVRLARLARLRLLRHALPIALLILRKKDSSAVYFTRGARSFSGAVSGFGQVVKSLWTREKPLDQSAIPLIAPSQLQPRL